MTEFNSQSEYSIHDAVVGLMRDFAVIVAFRDPRSAERTLMLQRGVDPQENEPGAKGVYLELGIQAAAAYGAVQRCGLTRNGCRIEIAAHSRPAFSGLSFLLVEFQIPDPQWEELRQHLEYIFEGCDCLEVGS